MKRISLFLTLTLAGVLAYAQSTNAQDRKVALGFKVGEPLGVNARVYLNNNRAIEAGFGTYGMLWGKNRKYGPRGYFKNTGWAFNVNYLFHTEREGKRFQAYYGFGGQITNRRSYPERLAQFDQYEKKTGIGGSGLAGVEYFLNESPLSLYADAGLYLEVVPVPAFVHIQCGVGARFNF